MFGVIREQHRHLGLIFTRLETSNELNQAIALVETAILSLLTIILSICLTLVPRNRKGVTATDSMAPPRSAER
jgi:hypothetical protein